MTLFVLLLLVTFSKAQDLTKEDMQTFQNEAVASYKRSETLMNVAIIGFVSLVIVVVILVLVRSFINKKRRQQEARDKQKENEIVNAVQTELVVQNR